MTTKVFIAGKNGMVGSALVRLYDSQTEFQVISPSRQELDLLDRNQVFEFIANTKPDLVIDAAARVGGIVDKNSYPVDFLSINLQIQTNLMDAAAAASVNSFVFLGSSCIYPKLAPQPLKESYLMTGPLEETNSAYAVAKIAGLRLIQAYREQFGFNWISTMPTNLYGPNDNFDFKSSHVIPGFIAKFHRAKIESAPTVELWGTGNPLREFLHVDDLAQAIKFVAENYNDYEFIFVLRFDLFLKDTFIDIFNPKWTKIMYPFAVYMEKIPFAFPFVSDTMCFIPNKYWSKNDLEL